MSLRLFAAFVVLCLSACASARGPEVRLSSLAHLKSHATESFDLDLGPIRLGIASWFVGKANDPDAVALHKTLKACKAVHIRHYEFAPDFEYPQEDIDAVRSQLSGPGWTQLATVRDKKARENVDVYVRFDQEKITGFIVLASERSEFTIVNIVGSFDVADIEKLSAQFRNNPHHYHRGTPPRS